MYIYTYCSSFATQENSSDKFQGILSNFLHKYLIKGHKKGSGHQNYSARHDGMVGCKKKEKLLYFDWQGINVRYKCM